MSEETPQSVEETPLEPPIAAEPVAVEQTDDLQSFEVPEEGRYVPIGAVHDLRAKNKDLKAEAERAKTLEVELEQLRAKHSEGEPIIAAARAIVTAAQQQPQPQATPVADDTAELTEIATLYDFWKTDGTPDLDRARKAQARERANVQRAATEATAPIVVRTLVKDATYNLERAKNTTYPDGSKADPAILDRLFESMKGDINGLRSWANEQTAQLIFNQAYAETMARKAVPRQASSGPPVSAPPPALHTEIAGGAGPGVPRLSAADRKVARDLDMTDADYAKTLATMPAGWGKR